MGTFFVPALLKGGHQKVKTWTKQVDLLSFDLLLVPVFTPGKKVICGTAVKTDHWSLVLIDMQLQSIKYYDSMRKKFKRCLDALELYISKEHLDKKGTALDTSRWSKETVKGIPMQKNGFDCGVFVCKYAEFLSRRAELSFCREDMVHFRSRMKYEIVKVDLMYP